MTTEKEQWQRFGATIAPLLDAAPDPHFDEHHWCAGLMTQDGISVQISSGQQAGKLHIAAWVRRDGPYRETAKLGEIGCSRTKSPKDIARDITRRLLPSAREKAAEARAKWAQLDAESAALPGIASLLTAAGFKTEITGAGTQNACVDFRYYHEEGGMLNGHANPDGTVSIQHFRLWGVDVPRLIHIKGLLMD